MDYALDAMGRVIQAHRDVLGLTQEDLGTQAGYRGGAAVSISRIENGFTRPTREKLEGIARALHTTVAQLESEARESRETMTEAHNEPGGREQLAARAQQISEEIKRRKATETELHDAYNDAYDRACDAFFIPFGQSIRAIAGALTLHADRLADDGAPSATADLAVRHQFPSGVDGLTPSAGVLAAANAVAHPVGRAVASGTLRGAIAFGTASTGVPTKELRGIAQTNAAHATLGRGTRANGGAGTAGGQRLLAGIKLTTALLVAISPVALKAIRSRKQQREFAENLEMLDAELRASQRGFGALTDMFTRATVLLEEIAVHAGRALDKWNAELGPAPLDWETLEPDLKKRCGELYVIAECQVAVDALDYSALMEVQGEDLERLICALDAELTRADDVVGALA